MYEIEIVPPKKDTNNLEQDLASFANKYHTLMEDGHCVCVADQVPNVHGIETVKQLGLEVKSEQAMIHLNTFHTKEYLHKILAICKSIGLKYLFVVSGDSSTDAMKIQPSAIGMEGEVESVSSVELVEYINKEYPNTFVIGVAFNPYHSKTYEFNKLQRKMDAGASFIVTQPILGKNPVVDELLEKYPHVPVTISASMTKKFELLSDAVEHEIPEDPQFEPFEALQMLQGIYNKQRFRLSFLSMKKQYDQIKDN